MNAICKKLFKNFLKFYITVNKVKKYFVNCSVKNYK